MTEKTSVLNDSRFRFGAIVLLLVLAVFGTYQYSTTAGATAQAATGTDGTADASGGCGPQPAAAGVSSDPALAGSNGAASSSGGCGMPCCGGGSSTPIEGTATLVGDVQKITVNIGAGGYDPNVIKLKAGVATKITFGQSQGCTGSVQSSDLGFQADLTSGPQTVDVPALEPGTYSFACGMGMVTGQIVVS